jgi:hypothetical protein
MATFFFTLDSLQITDTRSLHEDTDYVTFTLTVNGKTQTLTKSMGDVNNGVYGVGLTFQNVAINPSDTVVLNYLIVNSGNNNPTQIESLLESAAVKLVGQAGSALDMPELDSALEQIAKWLGDELISIFNTLCDGAVAAEQDTFVGSDLFARTANGPFAQSTRHPGTDSPHGCGGNSMYIVNWHVTQIGSSQNTTVPDVVDASSTLAATEVRARGLVPKFSGVPPSSKAYVQPKPGCRGDRRERKYSQHGTAGRAFAMNFGGNRFVWLCCDVDSRILLANCFEGENACSTISLKPKGLSRSNVSLVSPR